jgi:hypothetical protein
VTERLHDFLANKLESQLVTNLKMIKEFQTTVGALQFSEIQLRSELRKTGSIQVTV